MIDACSIGTRITTRSLSAATTTLPRRIVEVNFVARPEVGGFFAAPAPQGASRRACRRAAREPSRSPDWRRRKATVPQHSPQRGSLSTASSAKARAFSESPAFAARWAARRSTPARRWAASSLGGPVFGFTATGSPGTASSSSGASAAVRCSTGSGALAMGGGAAAAIIVSTGAGGGTSANGTGAGVGKRDRGDGPVLSAVSWGAATRTKRPNSATRRSHGARPAPRLLSPATSSAGRAHDGGMEAGGGHAVDDGPRVAAVSTGLTGWQPDRGRVRGGCPGAPTPL